MRKLDRPTFSGFNKEPTVTITVSWKEDLDSRIMPTKHQRKVAEICIFNVNDWEDLLNGIYRTRNGILQGRT